MIGFLLKIGVLLVLGVLAYNYFLGTEEEKAQSAKAFGQMKDVAVSVGELAKSEKEKFDAGKYDAALEKLGGAYKSLREGAQKVDAGLLKRVDELERRKQALRKELDSIEKADGAAAAKKTTPENAAVQSAKQQRRKEALQRDMDDLMRDSDALLKQAADK